MNTIKKFKNYIILILIVTSIIFSSSIIDFVSDAAKKIGKMFTASKPDYSNLSSQGYKIKSSSSGTKPSSSSSSSSGQSGQKSAASSMFKKKEPSAEELDQQIMGESKKQNDPRNERFERSQRGLNEGVDEDKMSAEKFDMDMAKEFDKF